MATLIVPKPDERPWPTLGPSICDWIEENLVYGPGDLRGQPYRIEPEFRALLYRMYEVVPQGQPGAGRRRFNRCAINVRKGTAKALALDTPVPTPSGWTTMGEIRVGDEVFDEQGRVCRVTDASEVFTDHDCYEVVFRDGSRIVADAGHRWYTESLAERYSGGVRTTEQIAATVVVRADGARNHRIPVAGPLQLPEADLPIDPWLLGAWLGDGRTDDCEFTMHADDYPEFCQSVDAAGFRAGEFKPDRRRPSTGSVRVFGLRAPLREAGLLGRKHVPSEYLRGSVRQRLALLQGLMDTDGTCARKGGSSSFTSTLLVLAEAVHELAASVGLKPSLRPTKTSGAPAWKVEFHADRSVPVFRLKRKADLQPERVARTPMSSNRHIVSCERVPTVPTRCIAVDSDSHLFLAGRAMIPTHNTEKASIIAACELHPEAPVRCDGWDAQGNPVGIGVRDPYVALVAYTQEQTEELGFNVLRTILGEGPLADDFDIGLERIIVLSPSGRSAGKAVPLTGAPGARDGARTTFQAFDETHRMTRPTLIKAHTTMLQNAYKRQMADAWTLETTTFHDPSELSVASDTYAYATAVHEGEIKDSRLFYFYRYCPPEMPMDTAEHVKAALVEASGPAAEWSADLDGLVQHWFEPKTDQNYYRRVWLNQRVAGAGKAFDSVKWTELADAGHVVPDRAKIALGFDGAKTHDGTAIIACELSTGFMWLAGYWQAPPGDDEWEVNPDEVTQTLEQLFDRYKVIRMYADPFFWTTEVDSWRGRWGDRVVISYATTLLKRIGMACQSFAEAIRAEQVRHDGGSKLAEHVGNATKQDTSLRGDDDVPLWTITKERRGSPLKIDAAMAAVLAWQARNDAVAAGALKRGSGRVASFN